MSKRGMDSQGGEERYGLMGGQEQGLDGADRPQHATAAQLARRKILQAKGTKAGSGRSSRAASPAIMPGPAGANPFASVMQSTTANGFTFTAPGSAPAPSFGEHLHQNGTSFGAQPQPNGTSSFGGFGQPNGTSGFSFGASLTNSQLQQNGFNPATSFAFGGTQSDTTGTQGTSFQFGQTQSLSQAQQNGFTPSTQTSSVFGASFGGERPQSSGATTFKFGEAAQEQTPKPSASYSFGQPPQPNGEKPAPTGLFGSTPAPLSGTTDGSVFSAPQTKTNGIKPGMFTLPKEQSNETPKPSSAFNSGDREQANGEQTVKLGNPFGGFVFGQASEQTKKPIAASSHPLAGFGSAAQADNLEAPKPAQNPFQGLQFGQPLKEQANPIEQPPKTNGLFGGVDKLDQPGQDSQFKFGHGKNQTPKPSNPFAGFGQQSQATSMPSLNVGAVQQEDTSMMSPDNTPQKERFSPTRQEHTAVDAPKIPPLAPPQEFGRETSADTNAGKSLFDRIARDPPAATHNPGSNPFSRPASTPSTSNTFSQNTNLFKGDETAPRASSQLFAPDGPSTSSAPLFQPTNAFGTETPAIQSRQPGLPASFSAGSSIGGTQLSGNDQLKDLNEGLLAHLREEDPTNDWSVILKYYLTEAAQIVSKDAAKPPPSFGLFSAPTTASASNSQSTNSKIAQPRTPFQPSKQSFSKPSFTPGPSKNIFGQQPSATVSLAEKRAADEDLTKASSNDSAAPTTDKRLKSSAAIEYPRLPATASDTAKLFASTLDKPIGKSSTIWSTLMSNGDVATPVGITDFGPPADVLAKVREQEAAKKAEVEKSTEPASSFKPATTSMFSSFKTTAATDKPIETLKAPTFGFMPSAKPVDAPKAPTFGFTPSVKPADAPKAPTFGFTPSLPAGTLTTGSGNFFASFGAKANANAEKEKKKRKEADYDSEEDDEAEWEARDRQKQEEAQKQFEEAAKNGPSFVVEPEKSGLKSKGLFDPLHTREAPVKEKTASAASSAVHTSKPNAAPSTTLNLGQPTSGDAIKTIGAHQPHAGSDQGPGDHTWSQNAPIKFGSKVNGNETTTPAATPSANPFSGLFGSNATPAKSLTSLFGSNATPATKDNSGQSSRLAPPSVGFSFGQSGASSISPSRATTPGVTTDGEASLAGDDNAEGEANDQLNEKQVDDMTDLLPSEREEEDVLLELDVARASKFDEKRTEDGTVPAWCDRGKGRLYMLKNKTTGRTRVVMKIPPLGKEAMNFEPKMGLQYQVVKPKTVLAHFFDHLGPKEKAKVPSRWTIRVREDRDAHEIARILMEGRR